MQIELSRIQNLLDWIKTKIYLDSNSINATKRVVRRCEVYSCNFGIGIGSEIQKERPCIIVQNNTRNSRSANVIVVPISLQIKIYHALFQYIQEMMKAKI